uniref:uncharacterized protein LOC128928709 n=1 Tax=Callithrix jacchus TaxID=9483 RepID=UPI0023DD424F|nr:uncharacterized protein LOC128928709 [Callithrix jacchus]
MTYQCHRTSLTACRTSSDYHRGMELKEPLGWQVNALGKPFLHCCLGLGSSGEACQNHAPGCHTPGFPVGSGCTSPLPAVFSSQSAASCTAELREIPVPVPGAGLFPAGKKRKALGAGSTCFAPQAPAGFGPRDNIQRIEKETESRESEIEGLQISLQILSVMAWSSKAYDSKVIRAFKIMRLKPVWIGNCSTRAIYSMRSKRKKKTEGQPPRSNHFYQETGRKPEERIKFRRDSAKMA